MKNAEAGHESNIMLGEVLVASRSEELPLSYIQSLLTQGESDLVEFKREWPDLSEKAGTAKLAKHVIAMANTVTPQEPGTILFGVEETPDGFSVCGVENSPDAETVSNILSDYVMPPPIVQCRDIKEEGQVVSVLTVYFHASRPHHSIRSHAGTLDPRFTYVRRDRTTGILTFREVLDMVSQQQPQERRTQEQTIQCGFVDTGRSSRSVTARVTNLIEEEMTGIDVIYDIHLLRDPSICYRQYLLNGARLEGGESREVDIKLDLPALYKEIYAVGWQNQGPQVSRISTSMRQLGSRHGDEWLNITLHVHFRDRDGFVRSIVQHLAVSA